MEQIAQQPVAQRLPPRQALHSHGCPARAKRSLASTSSSYLSGTALQLRPARREARAAAAAGGLRVEANVFGRFFRVVRSYTNSLLNQAEDPEKMLDQTVTEMQADLIKLRQASAQVMASQKQIENKYNQAQSTSDEWYKRAQLALSKGDEELAREALKRRKSYADNAATMKAQLDQQRKAVDSLISNTKAMEGKLVEARSKKDTLKARAKSAASAKQVQEMLQGLNTSNAVAVFDRMEEKVLSLEAEAESTLQLGTSDALETKFAALEGGDVDAELSRMKQGMLSSSSSASKGGGSSSSSSSSSSRQSLPQGRPVRDAIDYELEELRRKVKE